VPQTSGSPFGDNPAPAGKQADQISDTAADVDPVQHALHTLVFHLLAIRGLITTHQLTQPLFDRIFHGALAGEGAADLWLKHARP